MKTLTKKEFIEKYGLFFWKVANRTDEGDVELENEASSDLDMVIKDELEKYNLYLNTDPDNKEAVLFLDITLINYIKSKT